MQKPGKRRYEALLFDLDGTIVDSRRGIIAGMRYALGKMEHSEEGIDFLSFIGPPIHEAYQELFGDREKAWRAVEYYREYYREKGLFEVDMYHGIDTAIRRLRGAGYRLMLATSKPRVFAEKILENLGLREEFEAIGGASLDGTVSSKEQVIRSALEQSGVAAEDALMIGDRKFDLIGAQQMGMDAMGVLFGFGSRQELMEYPAVYLAETPESVAGYLLKDCSGLGGV